jgi:hypothetical protein
MNSTPDPANPLCSLSLTKPAPECCEIASLFSITYEPPSPVSTNVPYHLRDFRSSTEKSPSVSYHLQTLKPVTTCVPYHLQKTPGWGCLTASANSFVSPFHNAPNPPLCKPFRFNGLQTWRKAPLSNSFRIILLPNHRGVGVNGVKRRELHRVICFAAKRRLP